MHDGRRSRSPSILRKRRLKTDDQDLPQPGISSSKKSGKRLRERRRSRSRSRSHLALMVKHLPRRIAINLTEEGRWKTHDLVQDQSHPLESHTRDDRSRGHEIHGNGPKNHGYATYNHATRFHEIPMRETHGHETHLVHSLVHYFKKHFLRARSSRSPQILHTARSRNSSKSTAHFESNP